MIPGILRIAALAAFALVTSSPSTHAQDRYPSRPITIVVPAPAGGPTDTVARILTEAMSSELGQRMLVENVGGAGGTIGTAQVVRASPDGYTLLLYNIGTATAATLYRKLRYDTLNAFEYVGLITEVPMTIIGRHELPPNDLQGLLAYLRSKGPEVTYANAGMGSSSHLCGMLLMSTLGTQLTAVPYKGTGPAMSDILGGRIDLMCDQTTNTTNNIKAGVVKAYAVTTSSRLENLPDLPTTNEAGLKGFEISAWHGLYAPKNTPAAVIERLSLALRKALKDENVIRRFAMLGTAPVADADATPNALKARLESEVKRWEPIIKAAGMFAD